MAKVKTFDELEAKMSNFNISDYQVTICKNIKKIRKDLYNEYKYYYKENGLRNPYSSQSISELLGISYEYYKRLESYDKTKPISIKLFLKVVYLLDKNVEDFFK